MEIYCHLILHLCLLCLDFFAAMLLMFAASMLHQSFLFGIFIKSISWWCKYSVILFYSVLTVLILKREQAPGCSVEMKTFLLQISSLQIIPTGCCSNQASSKQTNLQKWNNNNCFDEFFFVEKNVEFNLEYLQNFWQRQWYTTSLDAYILLKLQQRWLCTRSQ